MKILFGGTFDPIHNGHLALALHIAKQFQHPVEFLPLNGIPNYKPQPQAKLSQRLAMLELAVLVNPQLLQIDYSETKFSTYCPTYTTITRLRQKHGTDEPFYFIIGGDSLISFDTWDNWQELLTLTNFIVATRPGYSFDSANSQLSSIIKPRQTTVAEFNPQMSGGQIIISNFAPIDISSTKIRNNCRQKLPITDMLPANIKAYLEKQQLYLS